MNNNYLKLNKNKTMVKAFWAKKLNPCIDNVLQMDFLDTVKVLGVTLNDNLNLKDFIAKKVQVCNMHLHNLYNVREMLDVKTRTLLVTSLVLSKVDYCNVLLLNCNKTELDPLRLVINKCVRFILNLNFRYHITPYYKKLHFLPIIKRIEYKACLLAHKIFFRNAPEYLNTEFKHHVPFQQMMLREGVGRDSFMFETDNNDIKDKLLFSKIRQAWNRLPLPIRNIQALPSFKSKLKTKLFSEF